MTLISSPVAQAFVNKCSEVLNGGQYVKSSRVLYYYVRQCSTDEDNRQGINSQLPGAQPTENLSPQWKALKNMVDLFDQASRWSLQRGKKDPDNDLARDWRNTDWEYSCSYYFTDYLSGGWHVTGPLSVYNALSLKAKEAFNKCSFADKQDKSAIEALLTQCQKKLWLSLRRELGEHSYSYAYKYVLTLTSAQRGDPYYHNFHGNADDQYSYKFYLKKDDLISQSESHKYTLLHTLALVRQYAPSPAEEDEISKEEIDKYSTAFLSVLSAIQERQSDDQKRYPDEYTYLLAEVKHKYEVAAHSDYLVEAIANNITLFDKFYGNFNKLNLILGEVANKDLLKKVINKFDYDQFMRVIQPLDAAISRKYMSMYREHRDVPADKQKAENYLCIEEAFDALELTLPLYGNANVTTQQLYDLDLAKKYLAGKPQSQSLPQSPCALKSIDWSHFYQYRHQHQSRIDSILLSINQAMLSNVANLSLIAHKALLEEILPASAQWKSSEAIESYLNKFFAELATPDKVNLDACIQPVVVVSKAIAENADFFAKLMTSYSAQKDSKGEGNPLTKYLTSLLQEVMKVASYDSFAAAIASIQNITSDQYYKLHEDYAQAGLEKDNGKAQAVLADKNAAAMLIQYLSQKLTDITPKDESSLIDSRSYDAFMSRWNIATYYLNGNATAFKLSLEWVATSLGNFHKLFDAIKDWTLYRTLSEAQRLQEAVKKFTAKYNRQQKMPLTSQPPDNSAVWESLNIATPAQAKQEDGAQDFGARKSNTTEPPPYDGEWEVVPQEAGKAASPSSSASSSSSFITTLRPMFTSWGGFTNGFPSLVADIGDAVTSQDPGPIISEEIMTGFFEANAKGTLANFMQDLTDESALEKLIPIQNYLQCRAEYANKASHRNKIAMRQAYKAVEGLSLSQNQFAKSEQFFGLQGLIAGTKPPAYTFN